MERASFSARGVGALVQNTSGWIYFVGDPIPWNDAVARSLIGGKALSLARLAQAGFDTPPAFTLTSDVYRNYLARGAELPHELWAEVRAALARLESAAGRQFGRPPNPLTVAVRSGAAESMPGILATFLHCGLSEPLVERIDDEAAWQAFAEFLDSFAPVCLGRASARQIAQEAAPLPPRLRCRRWLNEWKVSPCGPLADEPEGLLRATIAAVFNSWESLEARRYRDLQGQNLSDAPSVTVQAMFVTEVAGVVFSRNPARPEANELVVEATAGSGRHLVGGKITPTRWTVHRDSLAAKKASTRDTAAVANFIDGCLPRLCRDVLAIEALFNEAVDVEFGYAAGRLAYFQARPLQQGLSAAEVEQARAVERARLSELAAQGRDLWVRHNLAETLPSPTPLTWELWRAFMTGRGGWGRLHRRLGYRPSWRVGKDGFLELIAGRIYADPQRQTEMLCAGYPFTFDRDALRRDPAAINEPPANVDLEQLDPWFLLRWPLVVLTIARAGLFRRRLSKTAAERFDREVLPRVGSFVHTEGRFELTRLSLEELIGVFHRRRRVVFDDLAVECLLPGMLGTAAWNLLGQRLTAIMGKAQWRLTAETILAAISGSMRPGEEPLPQAACGELSAEAFLRDFGHRGPREMDLSSPRWREMPEPRSREMPKPRSREIPEAVLAWSRQVAGAPGGAAAAADSRTLDAARDALRRALGDRAAKVDTLLEQSARLLPYREIGKHEFLRAYALLRDVLLELGRRSGLGDGVHFLTLAEIDELPRRDDFRQTIATRREHRRACLRLYAPAVLELDDLEHFGRPPPRELGRSIEAKALSGGCAAGRVLLLDEGQQAAEAAGERVVVASAVDPACLPLMANAAALVLEQGGLLSHVALLARQLAIPLVVVEAITAQLAEGELVLVDADRGLIERKDPECPAG